MLLFSESNTVMCVYVLLRKDLVAEWVDDLPGLRRADLSQRQSFGSHLLDDGRFYSFAEKDIFSFRTSIKLNEFILRLFVFLYFVMPSNITACLVLLLHFMFRLIFINASFYIERAKNVFLIFDGHCIMVPFNSSDL